MDIYHVIAIFLLLDFFLLVYVFYKRKKCALTPKEKEFFKERWTWILNERDVDRAILDADKLLDLALRKKGYFGTLGQKLKSAGKLFSNLEDLWAAHKLRNRIAHELKPGIGLKQGQRALYAFEKALKDLQIL